LAVVDNNNPLTGVEEMKTATKTETVKNSDMGTADKAVKDAENKAKLDALVKKAGEEIGAYHGLTRKAAVYLYRAGKALDEAQVLAAALGVNRADYLSILQIADSTARQAVRFYRHVSAVGHGEAELTDMAITQAKLQYNVIPTPKAKDKPTSAGTSTPEKKDAGLGDGEEEDRISAGRRVRIEGEPTSADKGTNKPDTTTVNRPGPIPTTPADVLRIIVRRLEELEREISDGAAIGEDYLPLIDGAVEVLGRLYSAKARKAVAA